MRRWKRTNSSALFLRLFPFRLLLLLLLLLLLSFLAQSSSPLPPSPLRLGRRTRPEGTPRRSPPPSPARLRGSGLPSSLAAMVAAARGEQRQR